MRRWCERGGGLERCIKEEVFIALRHYEKADIVYVVVVTVVPPKILKHCDLTFYRGVRGGVGAI